MGAVTNWWVRCNKRGSLRSDSISRLMRTDIVEVEQKRGLVKFKNKKQQQKRVVHSHNAKQERKKKRKKRRCDKLQNRKGLRCDVSILTSHNFLSLFLASTKHPATVTHKTQQTAQCLCEHPPSSLNESLSCIAKRPCFFFAFSFFPHFSFFQHECQSGTRTCCRWTRRTTATQRRST